MEELREFRGYMNGRLLYTFPLHWVDSIKVKDGVMIVSYYDEMQLILDNLADINSELAIHGLGQICGYYWTDTRTEDDQVFVLDTYRKEIYPISEYRMIYFRGVARID